MARGRRGKKSGKSGSKGKGPSKSKTGQVSGELLEAARRGDVEAVIRELSGASEAASLIEVLSREAAPPVSVISAAAERYPSRDVEKAVKRAVFVLGRRGVPLDGLAPPDEGGTARTTGKQGVDPVEAYAGPYDVEWYRPVMLIIPRTGPGVHLALGIVSDQEGLGEFHFVVKNRKEARMFRDMFSEKKEGGLVSTTPAHAVSLLEEAYRRHRESGRRVPPEYLEVRSLLLEAAGEDEARGDAPAAGPMEENPPPLTLTMAAKLFSHPLMASWRLPPAAVEAFSSASAEVDSGMLVLSEAQKRERVMDLVEPRLKEVFSPEWTGRFMKRLEETAHLFAGRGEDDFERLCMAAAAAMQDPPGGFIDNPVFAVLMDRALGAGDDPDGRSGPAPREDPAGGGRLITF